MIMTFVVWIPLTLIVVVSRLVISMTSLTARLAVNSVKGVNKELNNAGTKKGLHIDDRGRVDKVVDKIKDTTSGGIRLGVNSAKKSVKLTSRVGKTSIKVGFKVARNIPKIAINTSKVSISLVRYTIVAIKTVITALSALISAIVSMGLVGMVCILILTIVVVAGGVFMSFWDDKIDIHTNKTESVVNQGVVMSGSSGDDKVTIGNPKLEDLDIAVLKYKVDKSKSSHKKNCSTSLSRKDVTKFSNLLMGKGNTMSRGGATVCKYLCYSRENSWGRSPSCNVIDLEKFSKSATVVNSGTLECKAGIPFSKSKVYVMDCSTFVGWFYATFFVAYDRNNKDLDELANWYIGLSSGDYLRTDLNKRIDRKDLKPGDIIHVDGHVCIYAGNGKCIGASQTSTGIKYGNLSYYENESSVTYHRPYFKFRGE